jgi:hypothetical protein
VTDIVGAVYRAPGGEPTVRLADGRVGADGIVVIPFVVDGVELALVLGVTRE